MFKRPPTVYITPPAGYSDREKFFTAWPLWATVRDRFAAHGIRFLCRKLRHIPPRASLILFNNITPSANIDRWHKKKLILIQWEPPTVLPYQHTDHCLARFGHILTMRDDLSGATKFSTPYPFKLHPSNPTRLITMVFGNKSSSHPGELYTHRRRLIEFFEEKPEADFTFYGTGWEHLGYRTYGGPVDDKLATISNFRFTIAYENCQGVPGYITEKILDCLCAGTIPIYWGAPNIADYIPSDCFIDRTLFSSDQALYDHLLTLDTTPYLEAAKRFLQSEKAGNFSIDRFIDQVTENILEALKPCGYYPSPDLAQPTTPPKPDTPSGSYCNENSEISATTSAAPR